MPYRAADGFSWHTINDAMRARRVAAALVLIAAGWATGFFAGRMSAWVFPVTAPDTAPLTAALDKTPQRFAPNPPANAEPRAEEKQAIAARPPEPPAAPPPQPQPGVTILNSNASSSLACRPAATDGLRHSDERRSRGGATERRTRRGNEYRARCGPARKPAGRRTPGERHGRRPRLRCSQRRRMRVPLCLVPAERRHLPAVRAQLTPGVPVPAMTLPRGGAVARYSQPRVTSSTLSSFSAAARRAASVERRTSWVPGLPSRING